ncbi:hypothetical protein [Frankia sp. Cppng1_Ct_nod]|uniref:hypothetical protein n=1 Tax=Frankia sp. Cppng1_Ct_nod TaxID=2897162 RepID=UPI001F5E826D|nr:hypothetical protein [Frankia sp. Cppng1_Ct_nod]
MASGTLADVPRFPGVVLAVPDVPGAVVGAPVGGGAPFESLEHPAATSVIMLSVVVTRTAVSRVGRARIQWSIRTSRRGATTVRDPDYADKVRSG